MVVSSSQTRFRKGAKSASGAPGQKSTPRGSKSATFAQGFFRPFNPQTLMRIQYENLPFYHSNIRYTCDSKLQLEKLLELEAGVFLDTDFEIYGSSMGVFN